MNDYKKIDYKALLLFLLKRLWIIALTAAVFGAGAFFFTKYMVATKYEATIRLYVNNRTETATTLTSSDVLAAKALVDTYITIIESDSFIDEIAESTGNRYTNEQIRNMLSASSINGTEVFEVSVSGTSPEECAHIANAIADLASDKISEIIEGSSVKIIDRAKVPAAPLSPNMPRNAAVAAVLGIAVSCVFFFIVFISDTTIYSEGDIREFCTLPVLGILPDFNQTNQNKYGYSNPYSGRSSKK